MQFIFHIDSGQIKFLFFGGAVGGGKSYVLHWYGIRRLIRLAERGLTQPVGMLCCEKYPSLKDRQLSNIALEFPSLDRRSEP